MVEGGAQGQRASKVLGFAGAERSELPLLLGAELVGVQPSLAHEVHAHVVFVRG